MVTTLRTRLRQKHDIEANWEKVRDFVPLSGEIIIYDPDENYPYARFKCGIWDGISEITDAMLINNLPFSNQPDSITIDEITQLFS